MQRTLALVLVAGCSLAGAIGMETDVPEPHVVQGDLCGHLQGRAFRSVAPRDCGLDASGEVARCRWSVAFDDDAWSWDVSDVGGVGTFACDGGVIEGVDQRGEAVNGTLDAATGTLIWQGLAYR